MDAKLAAASVLADVASPSPQTSPFTSRTTPACSGSGRIQFVRTSFFCASPLQTPLPPGEGSIWMRWTAGVQTGPALCGFLTGREPGQPLAPRPAPVHSPPHVTLDHSLARHHRSRPARQLVRHLPRRSHAAQRRLRGGQAAGGRGLRGGRAGADLLRPAGV